MGYPLFVRAGAHWLGTVGGRVFFVHAGAQRTLCFCSHINAHANYRKLRHFLYAFVLLERHWSRFLGRLLKRPPIHCHSPLCRFGRQAALFTKISGFVSIILDDDIAPLLKLTSSAFLKTNQRLIFIQ